MGIVLLLNPKQIQIQHLLKLNDIDRIAYKLVFKYSNTTLVKVKSDAVGVYFGTLSKFKYNTC